MVSFSTVLCSPSAIRTLFDSGCFVGLSFQIVDFHSKALGAAALVISEWFSEWTVFMRWCGVAIRAANIPDSLVQSQHTIVSLSAFTFHWVEPSVPYAFSWVFNLLLFALICSFFCISSGSQKNVVGAGMVLEWPFHWACDD